MKQPTVKEIKVYMKMVGDNLRLARRRRKITQKQLAKIVGVTQYHISRLEWGDQNITLTMLYKLCRALDMMPEEMVDSTMKGRFAI